MLAVRFDGEVAPCSSVSWCESVECESVEESTVSQVSRALLYYLYSHQL